MITVANETEIQNAIDIPQVTADETYTLMRTELERFLRLVDTLDADDWSKPTACTAWTVRNVLAHQAGGYASGTSYREMIRQYIAKPLPGQLPEDAVNDLQVRERDGQSPAELITELRTVGPVAIRKWAYQFRAARLLTRLVKVPHPVTGTISFEYLMWIIHSRDTWMHRLDICRATQRPFEQTEEHDGRIAELVMLDTVKNLAPKLKGKAIVFDLSGIAGGTWKVGTGETVATVNMDVLDFNILASGRFNLEEGLQRAVISGDAAFAKAALEDFLILY